MGGGPGINVRDRVRGPHVDLGVEGLPAKLVGDPQAAVVLMHPLRVGPELRDVDGLAGVAPWATGRWRFGKSSGTGGNGGAGICC